jgi:D-psicose/D-tagatose/L-ribulose 3-epimerase
MMSGSGTWRMAVSEWTLREPETARALGRIADAGFDAVELGGRVGDQPRTKRALASSGLDVTSICPLFGAEHDFAAEDAAVRRAAADLLRRWIDFGGEVGAAAVIVVPSDRPSPAGRAPRADLLLHCAETIADVVSTYDGAAPVVVIEPINRYETHLVRTVAEAEQLRRAIDSPQVALMVDLFHMNLEEDSLTQPVRDHAANLAHVHLADNQRREPGSGRLDFEAIFDVLEEIDYRGSLALEFLPASDAALRRAREYLQHRVLAAPKVTSPH